MWYSYLLFVPWIYFSTWKKCTELLRSYIMHSPTVHLLICTWISCDETIVVFQKNTISKDYIPHPKDNYFFYKDIFMIFKLD